MRVLFDITCHGYGHLAQSAPVIAELRRACPDIDVLIWSGLPESVLRSRISGPFRLIPSDLNSGLKMLTTFEVDCAGSLHYHRNIMRRRQSLIQESADLLRRERVDVLVSNMGYLSCAAAAKAGIRSLAFCSLSWSDVLPVYAHGPDCDEVVAFIKECYSGADRVLQLLPGSDMQGLNVRRIESLVIDKRLAARLRRHSPSDYVLVGLSGDLPDKLNFEQRLLDEYRVVAPGRLGLAGVQSIESTAQSFQSLLAEAALVVTKVGYGIVSELAIAGIPAIFVDRPLWPEQANMLEWLQRRCNLAVISHGEIVASDMVEELLQARDKRASGHPILTDGARKVVEEILAVTAG